MTLLVDEGTMSWGHQRTFRNRWWGRDGGWLDLLLAPRLSLVTFRPVPVGDASPPYPRVLENSIIGEVDSSVLSYRWSFVIRLENSTFYPSNGAEKGMTSRGSRR
ncbi:Hypothetical protein NTJ_10337 [Nesidiocoris tenuis]|uniref:Uncharacterized protein n=1 Tax=Nesidiocoris tenuis TaxID=355587 RepID=A0ABN7AZX7_9HEMI|nr:Hypothetical protein NTJ_10337 [Nesidiocoris tenuis]